MPQAPSGLEAQVLRGLDDRLITAARHIRSDLTGEARPGEPGSAAAALLQPLIEVARRPESAAQRWLLFVAIHGRFPATAEFLRLSRAMESESPEVSATAMLANALASKGPYMDQGMRVVTGIPVVEVNSSAYADFVSGIQRTVRETVARWSRQHELVPAVWHARHRALRALSGIENGRLFNTAVTPGDPRAAHDPGLVVPFMTDLLLVDSPVSPAADVLTCLARFSGNRVAHVGYDLIPITSADVRIRGEASNSAALLSVIKHSTSVAAISVAAADEFRGFVSGLGSQGLAQPVVREIPLPDVGSVAHHAPTAKRSDQDGLVRIVCPGTKELHKNHESILFAAERLWREGLDFELRLVGRDGGDVVSFNTTKRRLLDLGRPIVDLGGVTDDVLWTELGSADAAVFISLQEGYGLPIVEALSVGTPVITTDYGSQAEIGAQGGCLLVDPRDDDSITGALRRMVTDADLRAELRDQIGRRPRRTWDDYAADLWEFFIGDGEGGAA